MLADYNDYNDYIIGFAGYDMEKWQSDHMDWIFKEIEKIQRNEKKEHFEKEEDLFKI